MPATLNTQRTVFTGGKSFPITMTQNARTGRFTVSYGQQVNADLPYSMAARILGSFIMHDAACAGLLEVDTDCAAEV